MSSNPDSAGLIRAGAALSLSGRFMNQGEQARRGLVLWAEDVNAAGGLTVGTAGRSKVDLVIHDDASRSREAADLAERLIVRDRIDLLFGPYSSVLTLVAAPVAERHAKLLWNHGGSSDVVNQRGFHHVVSVLSPASRYFDGVLEMVGATAPEARRLALVYGASGTFPRAVIGEAEACARQQEFEVVFREPYPRDGESMAALVTEVAAARPDLILGAGTTETELEFARSLREAGLKTAIALVAAPIELFGETLGTDAEGFIGPSQWEPGVAYRPDFGPTSAEFVARFRQRFGAEPDYPAAQAYAAGLVAQQCIHTAGTLHDAALLEVAHRLALTTFYGDFRLDEVTGEQVGHALVVVQWQDRAKRVVWPPDAAEAPPRLTRTTQRTQPTDICAARYGSISPS